MQVALRQSDGRPRHDVQLLEAFHLEAERAASQPVVYGSLDDGTGAVAPLSCPPQARLVLDAAQMLSIGSQKGPPIGVQKGPRRGGLCR